MELHDIPKNYSKICNPCPGRISNDSDIETDIFKPFGNESSERMVDTFRKLRKGEYDFPSKHFGCGEKVCRSIIFALALVIFGVIFIPFFLISFTGSLIYSQVIENILFGVKHVCCRRRLSKSIFGMSEYGFYFLEQPDDASAHRFISYRSQGYIYYYTMNYYITLCKYLSGYLKQPLITDDAVLLFVHLVSASSNCAKFKYIYDNNNQIIGCEDDYTRFVNDTTMSKLSPIYSKYHITQVSVDYSDNNRITFHLLNGDSVSAPDSNDKIAMQQYNNCKAHYQSLISLYAPITHTWTHFGLNDLCNKYYQDAVFDKKTEGITVLAQLIRSHIHYTASLNTAGPGFGMVNVMMAEWSLFEWLFYPWKMVPLNGSEIVNFFHRLTKDYYAKVKFTEIIPAVPLPKKRCKTVFNVRIFITFMVLIGIVIYSFFTVEHWLFVLLAASVNPVLYLLGSSCHLVLSSSVVMLGKILAYIIYVLLAGFIEYYCVHEFFDVKTQILIGIGFCLGFLEIFISVNGNRGQPKKVQRDFEMVQYTAVNSSENVPNGFLVDETVFPNNFIKQRSNTFTDDENRSKYRGFSPTFDMLADYYDVIYTHWVKPLCDTGFIKTDELTQLSQFIDSHGLVGINKVDPMHILSTFLWTNLVHDVDHMVVNSIMKKYVIGNIHKEFDISDTWQDLLHGNTTKSKWLSQFWALRNTMAFSLFIKPTTVTSPHVADTFVDENLYDSFSKCNLSNEEKSHISAMHKQYLDKMNQVGVKWDWLVHLDEIQSSIAY